jgi:hypothetical protein
MITAWHHQHRVIQSPHLYNWEYYGKYALPLRVVMIDYPLDNQKSPETIEHKNLGLVLHF